MKVTFHLRSFSHSNFVLFFFLCALLSTSNFSSIFSVFANFAGKTSGKICFVCEQKHGKEKSHYISNTFSLASSFPFYYMEGFQQSAFLSRLFGGEGIGEVLWGTGHSLFRFLLGYYLLRRIRPLAKANFSLI